MVFLLKLFKSELYYYVHRKFLFALLPCSKTSFWNIRLKYLFDFKDSFKLTSAAGATVYTNPDKRFFLFLGASWNARILRCFSSVYEPLVDRIKWKIDGVFHLKFQMSCSLLCRYKSIQTPNKAFFQQNIKFSAAKCSAIYKHSSCHRDGLATIENAQQYFHEIFKIEASTNYALRKIKRFSID